MNIMGRGNDGALDRVLDAPTNEAWIDPWVALLRELGVQFHVGQTVDGARRPRRQGRRGERRATARAAAAGSRPTGSSRRCPPSGRASCGRRRCSRSTRRSRGWTSSYSTGWTASSSTCAEPVDITNGHVDVHRRAVGADRAHPGAVLGASATSPRDYGDGTAVDCLSVDISDWDAPGHPLRQARQAVHARARSPSEVWAQIKRAPQGHAARSLPDGIVHSWFLDPAIQWHPRRGRNTNATPLLVNTVGSWEKRPKAADEDPEPVPGRRLRADRHRPGDDGGRERVGPRRGQRAARGDRLEGRARDEVQALRPAGVRGREGGRPELYNAGQPNALDVRARRAGAERADAVVVGARCAGSATAIALARAGRRVVALDGAQLPVRHALDPPAVRRRRGRAEARSARWSAVEALGAPRAARATWPAAGIEVRGRLHAGRRASTTRCACAGPASTPRWSRPRARRARRCASAATVDRARRRRRPGRGRRATATRRRRARAPRAARRRRRRPPLDGRAAGRRRRAVPRRTPTGARCYFAYWRDGAARAGARVAAQWRDGPRARHGVPVRRRPRARAADAAGRARPASSAATSTASTSDRRRDARAAERLDGCERVDQGALATDTTSYFRRSQRAGLGAGRRRRALQGPGHRAGHPRRAALRAAARRGGRAGARRSRPRSTGRCARWERAASASAWRPTSGPTGSARAEAMTPLEVELYRDGRGDPALGAACSTCSRGRCGPARCSLRGCSQGLSDGPCDASRAAAARRSASPRGRARRRPARPHAAVPPRPQVSLRPTRPPGSSRRLREARALLLIVPLAQSAARTNAAS